MRSPSSFPWVKAAAQAASDKQGQDILALDVRHLTSVADSFLFITGTSHVHVRTLEDAIRDRLRNEGASLKRTDGLRGHSWRVLDYGDMLVHIMETATREFYAVERLWNQGKKIPVLKTTSKRPRPKKSTKVKKKRK